MNVEYAVHKSDLIDQCNGRDFSKLEILHRKVTGGTFEVNNFQNELFEHFRVVSDTVFLGDNAEETLAAPIFMLMVGYGIADKDKTTRHNQLLINFLTESKQTKLLEKFESFWENPFTSQIKYISSSAIYSVNNSICTPLIIKLKSSEPKVIFLMKPFTEYEDRIPLNTFNIRNSNFLPLFLSLR